jgi:hypothetical protein
MEIIAVGIKVDWKKTLGTVAPALATALGGPLVGVAVSMAGKALGLGDGATEAEIESAVLGGNPEVLLKLKECDNNFKLELERLGVKLEEIGVADRSSAREMAKADMRPQIALSIVFIGGYFFAMLALHGVLFEEKEINTQIVALFGALVGVFTRELSGIMQFWFGSSSGSAKKTETLGHIARGKDG